MRRIYLDNNATTALDPRVFKAMYQDVHGEPCNPSSIHYFGQMAKSHLQEARRKIASYLGVKVQEIIFTSSGTEAINMAIRGHLGSNPKGHIITTDIEHSCIFETVLHMQQLGCSVTFLNPGLKGYVTPEDVDAAIKPDTKMIVLSYVNGETGVKTNIDAIATIALNKEIPFIVDAVALMGKEEFEIPKGVSIMCFSGHKFHAPKGTGFLYIRSNQKLSPMFTGGDQEFQRRAGTENLEGIIGLAYAVALLEEELPEKSHSMQTLRDHLELGLKEQVDNLLINGEGPRVVNVSNLSFPGVDGETLLMNLDMNGIAASHGSACSSGAIEPSRILRNMGIDQKRARSSIRFSLSRFTTKDEIEKAVNIITDIIKKIRSL